MSVLAILLACALAAVVELDNAAAGQFMISRPIVLGPFLGLLFGRSVLGVSMGAICELFCLEDLPVGGSLPMNATVLVSTTAILSLALNVRFEFAFPAGLLAGWLHSKLDSRLRRRRGRLNAVVDGRLKAGQRAGLGGLAARELATQAAATFVLIAAFVAAGALLARGGRLLPESVSSGLLVGLTVSPFLGAWSLARSFKVVS